MPATEHRAELGAALLQLARAAIAHQLGLGPAPTVPTDPALAELQQRGATFVTLTLHGELRGCIGSLRRTRNLGDDVIANARAAAFHDPRFAPLEADEFAAIRIEVSLLTDPVFIEFKDEAELLRQLRPHEDGLILFGQCRSATFLPQVWDQLPEPAQFVAALKRKAGLPADRVIADLMAARYSVEKWHEEHP